MNYKKYEIDMPTIHYIRKVKADKFIYKCYIWKLKLICLFVNLTVIQQYAHNSRHVIHKY